MGAVPSLHVDTWFYFNTLDGTSPSSFLRNHALWKKGAWGAYTDDEP